MKTTPLVAGIALAGLSNVTLAQSNLNISAVLDGYYQSEHLEGGLRDEGFNLGHSEVALSAPVDDKFYGKITGVFASHDGELEFEIEEAFIQTTALPGGLGIRGGRFLSDIGYLNNQHSHTDNFAERPVVYRNLIGSHYYDDGLRINWVAPTPIYLNLFVEGFSGNQLALEEHSEHGDHEEHEEHEGHEEEHEGHEEHGDDHTIGVITFGIELGGDIGTDHSWQLGLSSLNNKSGSRHLHPEDMDFEPHEEEEHGHDDHGHGHGPTFGGERLNMADFTYKWAPNGNYKYESFTLAAEYIQAKDAFEHYEAPGDNSGWYASAAYRFGGKWTVGAMYSQFEGYEFHEFDDLGNGEFEAEFDKVTTKETQLSFTYHPSHFTNIRLFGAKQKLTGHEDETINVVGISFNTTLGDHSAHAF